MNCFLCPLQCGADRSVRAGACGTKGITVAKAYLHPYEEPFLSPNGRSGTVFFGGCSLRCVFCQNYELSRAVRGKELSPKELSEVFRRLVEEGAENIDLVTPDHLIPDIAEALSLWKPPVPVIFNSGGYVLRPALEEIAPLIDVWLPDMKFASPLLAKRLTGREDYPAVAKEAISYMASFPSVWDGDKLVKGTAVRVLLLPAHVEDCKRVLGLLREMVPPDTPLSLMRQYVPMGDLDRCPELRRTVTDREYRRAADYALSIGFTRLYGQESGSADPRYIPDWDS